jgi:hypothetical protein
VRLPAGMSHAAAYRYETIEHRAPSAGPPGCPLREVREQATVGDAEAAARDSQRYRGVTPRSST